MDLQGYMSGAIRRIMEKAYRNVLGNPREAKTVAQMRTIFEELGFTVAAESFSCKGEMGPLYSGHPDANDLQALREFAMQIINHKFEI